MAATSAVLALLLLAPSAFVGIASAEAGIGAHQGPVDATDKSGRQLLTVVRQSRPQVTNVGLGGNAANWNRGDVSQRAGFVGEDQGAGIQQQAVGGSVANSGGSFANAANSGGNDQSIQGRKLQDARAVFPSRTTNVGVGGNAANWNSGDVSQYGSVVGGNQGAGIQQQAAGGSVANSGGSFFNAANSGLNSQSISGRKLLVARAVQHPSTTNVGFGGNAANYNKGNVQQRAGFVNGNQGAGIQQQAVGGSVANSGSSGVNAANSGGNAQSIEGRKLLVAQGVQHPSTFNFGAGGDAANYNNGNVQQRAGFVNGNQGAGIQQQAVGGSVANSGFSGANAANSGGNAQSIRG